MTVFQNRGAGKKRVAFGAPYPGKIIPIRLAEIGGELLAQKDAFLCAAKGVSIGIAFTKRFGAGLFGGEGFILERLQGDGLAFIHAGGTIHQRELAPAKCFVWIQAASLPFSLRWITTSNSLAKSRVRCSGGRGVFCHSAWTRANLAAIVAVKPPCRAHHGSLAADGPGGREEARSWRAGADD